MKARPSRRRPPAITDSPHQAGGRQADLWHLRHHPALGLKLAEKMGAPTDNAIDVYLSQDYEDVIEGWRQTYLQKAQPSPLKRKDLKR